jgi:hypothetical protein
MSPCEQLEITDHYSGGELDGALAPARQARSYRAARELAQVDARRALIEALYLAVAILHNRLSGRGLPSGFR